ncbi:hypothetical protein MEX01_53690 [Methylorubrum extorquens]|uniref:DUF6894 family protein n=1 Tax=Methylorubrum extorquens TaxID=408 RepID=UPI00116F086D|nr:hypothetical protein [Methylorubrum extorquens]GEL44778.1 hypothetical protein MEX01_53690 [Methylorubrum extorquens]
MARYFFDIIDGQVLPDMEGADFASPAQARAEAIATAGEMLRDAGLRSWDGSEWRMLVRDEESRTVLSLRFSAE